MLTLKSHICKAYKEREEIIKESLNFLCELENKKINESDYFYGNYNDLIIKLEDKDYEDLLEDEEIKKHIQKITWKEEIKMDFLIKWIIDRTVFDIMILKIKNEERKEDKSKELTPESYNIYEIIEEIEDNPNITSLNLSNKSLIDNDIEELVKILPKTKIKFLGLRRNNIWPDWLEALAKNNTFRSLNLIWNDIWDNWAKALAKNDTLRSLNLFSNKIWDDWAKALAENDTLRFLDIGLNFKIKNREEIRKLCKANNIILEISE